MIINYFLIAIALSMDAFAISTALSVNKLLNKLNKILLIIFVGILHFLMPLLGNRIVSFIPFNLDSISKYLLSIIFLILGIEVLTSKEKIKEKVNVLVLLIISITVSLDSFTVGMGLSLTNEYNILASVIFSTTSMFFTALGIYFGKVINKYIKKTNFIGAIILFILSIKYLF